MLTRNVSQGGLWEEDIQDLAQDPYVLNLKVELEIDQYHFHARYEYMIICPSCMGTDDVKMKINDEFCREYECTSCNARWIDQMDFHLWLDGGKELMEKLNGGK